VRERLRRVVAAACGASLRQSDSDSFNCRDTQTLFEGCQYALAKAIGVPARRINEIVKGERSITADTAVRLGAFFGTDPQSGMNLQTHYDAEMAKKKIGAEKIKEIRQHALAA